MRAHRSAPLLSLLLLLALSSPALAETLSVPVGRDATLLNIDTGERIVRGRILGRARIDTRRVRAGCVRRDADFEGLVEIRTLRGSSRRVIQTLCLRRLDEATPVASLPGAEPRPLAEGTEVGAALRDTPGDLEPRS